MRKYILVSVPAVLIVIAVANYFNTFNNFVTRTESERQACEFYKIVKTLDSTQREVTISAPQHDIPYLYTGRLSQMTQQQKSFTDDQTEWVKSISAANYKVYDSYRFMKEKSCKTIEQFYIEEIALLSVAGICLYFWYKKFHV